MAEKKIQAVLFDVGETLLNFGKVDVPALFKEGGKLAHNYLVKLGQPAGTLKMFLFKHLWKVRLWSLWSYITKKDFDSLEILRKMGQKKNVRLSEQQWQDYGWCWYEPLSKVAKVEPDIKQTLEKLKQAGIKMGILSNTFINAVTLERHLEMFGIAKFLSIKVYSYQYGFRKPDPRIFAETAEKMNCKPENVLFVGDRLDLDVAGARAAKMPVILKKAYTNGGKEIPQDVMIIDKISELPGIIEEINGQ